MSQPPFPAASTPHSTGEPGAAEVLSGLLRVYVAFDWGDEIDLDRARRLGAGVVVDMMRRPRTPASIAYRPPPLRFSLEPGDVTLPGPSGLLVRLAEATVFDFAGVSLSLQLPFQLPRRDLRSVAARLAEPATVQTVVQTARGMLEPLYHRLLPAICRPTWRENFWEEYYVFQFPPGLAVAPDALLRTHAGWTAGMLRMEEEELAGPEIAEALRLVLRYRDDDLFVPDWAAALLVDREAECEETLQAVEFGNLQLLELREIDQRLDRGLREADDLLRKASRSWLPFWRRTDHRLRLLGEQKVEANGLFERTGDALKLIGDQYLARAYRMLGDRLHLPEWKEDIQRTLGVIEGVYQVVSNQSSTFRGEVLEILVVVLIFVELVLAVFGRH